MLGWSYVSKRGAAGAYFERIESAVATEKKLLAAEEELGDHRRRLIELLRLKPDDTG